MAAGIGPSEAASERRSAAPRLLVTSYSCRALLSPKEQALLERPGLPPETARILLREQEQVLIFPRLGGGNRAQNAASAMPLMRNKSA